MEDNMENVRIYYIKKIDFFKNIMNLTVDNKTYSIDVSTVSSKLTDADQRQKTNFEISPSGYGIHWPEIDEDLSIDGLIGKKNAVERRPSHRHEIV